MLKQPQARGDQLATLEALIAADALDADRAVRAPDLAGANLMNRLFARGWIARCGPRWWITEGGREARRYAVAYAAAQAQEAA